MNWHAAFPCHFARVHLSCCEAECDTRDRCLWSAASNNVNSDKFVSRHHALAHFGKKTGPDKFSSTFSLLDVQTWNDPCVLVHKPSRVPSLFAACGGGRLEPPAHDAEAGRTRALLHLVLHRHLPPVVDRVGGRERRFVLRVPREAVGADGTHPRLVRSYGGGAQLGRGRVGGSGVLRCEAGYSWGVRGPYVRGR